MRVSKHARWAILPALAVGLILGCRGGDGPGIGKPSPTTATPSGPATGTTPAAAPSRVTRIAVPVTDPNTGETVELEVEFDEGAGTGDDPTKEGRRGETLVRVGGESAIVFPLDEDGTLRRSIGLGAVECDQSYLISRYIDQPTNVDGCAPPAAMAAQFNRVKDDALATAVDVVKECWKKPSCGARVVFQGSMRYCYRTPAGTWFLYTCYEVRVICLSL